MSLSVKSLNGDTTFLITFTPSIVPEHSRHKQNFPGAFTILVDPWLVGHSSVWNTKFQISHHTSKPVVSSLTDLPKPDLIIISQSKPDHCHKETLCTLPRDTSVRILAVPDAAKQIRSWRYFQDSSIVILNEYDCNKTSTIYCVKLNAYTAHTTPGRMTISFINEKNDMTGLHNAIGITYRPPGTSFISEAGCLVDLPMTPPQSPSRSEQDSRPQSRDTQSSSDQPLRNLYGADSPMAGQVFNFQHSSERTISVLYSPHGMSYTRLAPYVETHLAAQNALPLHALFHSINVEQNPRIMGGLVAHGFPGGLDLVQKIGAKHWISAHDEVKDNRGWATIWIKSRPYTLEEAQGILNKVVKNKVRLTVLDSGQQIST